MRQVIGKLTTTILRDVVFEVADDAVVENGMMKITNDPKWPNTTTSISLGCALERGLARVVFDGLKDTGR
jgi:hypothetical protein